MRSKGYLLFLAASATLLALAIGLVFLHAQRTLSTVARAQSDAQKIPFTLNRFEPPPNPGFEPVASPQTFTTGTLFQGTLYLAGPSGLALYSPDASIQRILRPGLELPVAPIVAIAATRLRNASEPQILLATAGDGLFLLTPKPFTLSHFRPAADDLADLTALLPLPTGEVLLGTRHHGLLTFDGTTLSPVPTPALDITALASPTPGALIIGTRTQGAFYAHAGTITHIESTPDPDIEAIVATSATAYLGTPRGIAQLDLAAARITQTLAPNLFAHTLALTPDTLEVGTLDQGIIPIPLAPRVRTAGISTPLIPDTRRIDAFLTPTDALANGTLIHRTQATWNDSFLPSQTLTDSNISALAFTPSGHLYIGFFDHGLDILSPATNTRTHLEDDHLFCIDRLVFDPTQGTIAAATANGLVLFDQQGTPRQTLTRHDGLLADHITDVAFTPTGPVIATPAGLTFLTPSGPQSINAFQGMVNNHVYTLATSGSDLLAGTLGGLSILQNDQIHRNFTVTTSTLKHNWITALAPTAPGTYLVGTYGAGLETLSPAGGFTAIDLPAGTPRDLVINPNALLVTATHTYAGTLGHGLLVFTNSTGRWRTITTGLPSLNVTAFAARAGVVYIGTENGLVRIDEARL